MKLPKMLAAVAAGALLPLTATVAQAAAPAPAPAPVPAPLAAPAPQVKFAPYVDITQPKPTLGEIADASGQKNFTLAFVLAGAGGCNPMWGGQKNLDDPGIAGQIKDLKAKGGDVAVATGGAMGPYLESTCTTPQQLADAYKKILDATGSNHLDVDVEANISQDTVNQALAAVQKERGTKVSYTLRIQDDQTGMDPYSVQVLQSAAKAGVDVTVNPMTMDFGASKPWGDAVISASEAVLEQMKTIWPDRDDADQRAHLSVTPMIGKNDTGSVFTQDHAKQLLDWATKNQIGALSFWSAGRDNGSCPGGGVSPQCSSIEQQPYEFTNIFKSFGG